MHVDVDDGVVTITGPMRIELALNLHSAGEVYSIVIGEIDPRLNWGSAPGQNRKTSMR